MGEDIGVSAPGEAKGGSTGCGAGYQENVLTASRSAVLAEDSSENKIERLILAGRLSQAVEAALDLASERGAQSNTLVAAVGFHLEVSGKYDDAFDLYERYLGVLGEDLSADDVVLVSMIRLCASPRRHTLAARMLALPVLGVEFVSHVLLKAPASTIYDLLICLATVNKQPLAAEDADTGITDIRARTIATIGLAVRATEIGNTDLATALLAALDKGRPEKVLLDDILPKGIRIQYLRANIAHVGRLNGEPKTLFMQAATRFAGSLTYSPATEFLHARILYETFTRRFDDASATQSPAEQRRIFQKAHNAMLKAVGPHNNLTGAILAREGAFHLGQWAYDDAIPAYKKALHAFDASVGLDSGSSLSALYQLSNIALNLKSPEIALRYVDEVHERSREAKQRFHEIEILCCLNAAEANKRLSRSDDRLAYLARARETCLAGESLSPSVVLRSFGESLLSVPAGGAEAHADLIADTVQKLPDAMLRLRQNAPFDAVSLNMMSNIFVQLRNNGHADAAASFINAVIDRFSESGRGNLQALLPLANIVASVSLPEEYALKAFDLIQSTRNEHAEKIDLELLTKVDISLGDIKMKLEALEEAEEIFEAALARLEEHEVEAAS